MFYLTIFHLKYFKYYRYRCMPLHTCPYNIISKILEVYQNLRYITPVELKTNCLSKSTWWTVCNTIHTCTTYNNLSESPKLSLTIPDTAVFYASSTHATISPWVFRYRIVASKQLCHLCKVRLPPALHLKFGSTAGV